MKPAKLPRLAFLLVFTAIAVAHTGCGSDGSAPAPVPGPNPGTPDPVNPDPGDPDPGDPTPKPSANPNARTYVGRILGTDAMIAIVADDDQAAAYVCGGAETYKTMSGLLHGGIEGHELFLTDAASGTNPLNKAVLDGVIKEGLATGVLATNDGQTKYEWVAELADPTVGAGLHTRSDDQAQTALIVTNQQEVRGVSIAHNSGNVNQVFLPGSIALNGTQQLYLNRSTLVIEVVLVVDPIELIEGGLPNPIDPSDPIDPPVEYAGTLEIKFRDDYHIRLVGDRPVDLNGKGLDSAGAKTLFDEVSAGKWSTTHKVSEAQLNEMNLLAEKYWGKSMPDLNHYFRLRLPSGLDAEKLRAAFAALDEVEAAYIAPVPVAPPLPADYTVGVPGDMLDNPLDWQGYLIDADNGGVDAEYAWTLDGGKGHKVKIVDIEYGFLDKHQDLPAVDLVAGDTLDLTVANADHGTAVLGILAGQDNGFGVTGIAHEADIIVKTPYDADDDYNVAGTLTTAAFAVNAGDVILIEQQAQRWIGIDNGVACATSDLVEDISDCPFQLMPVEWYKPAFDAIQQVVAIGRIVIEPAGNGNQNLDVLSDPEVADDNQGHDPFATNAAGNRINDSGAILVGGVQSTRSANNMQRGIGVNYGECIDVSAWSDSIVTSGGDQSGPNGNGAGLYNAEGNELQYRNNFSGTSGASAIVAGCVAVAQSVFIQERGVPATPDEMRKILRDTGRPAEPGSGATGPMPDLHAALDVIQRKWDAPTFFPAASVGGPPLHAPVPVSLLFADGQDQTNTALLFTLNGTDPDENGDGYDDDGVGYMTTPEGDALEIYYSVRMKARSYATGYYPQGDRPRSEVVTAEFSLIDGTVDEPGFSVPETPGGGLNWYVGTLNVELYWPANNPDAEIWYCRDQNGITAGEPYPGGPNSVRYTLGDYLNFEPTGFPGATWPVAIRAYDVTQSSGVPSASEAVIYHYDVRNP